MRLACATGISCRASFRIPPCRFLCVPDGLSDLVQTLIQGLCAVIWNNQIQKVGAAKASIFLNLQPFVAMLVGFFVLGTPVTFVQVGGSILIVCGVVLSTIQRLEYTKGFDELSNPFFLLLSCRMTARQKIVFIGS
ncbi:EamA family transporter [Paenibacillus amylolyticus]|uniref:EamA family transporter n=1 Tax=Paenibacillus amylolyticus TaxID=1451 RepID=UPI003D9743AD